MYKGFKTFSFRFYPYLNPVMNSKTTKILLVLAAVVFLLPSVSYALNAPGQYNGFALAAKATQMAVEVREEYNRHLIGAVSNQFLSNPILKWSGGLTKWLFAYCFIIALFQTVAINDEKTQMREWVRLAFCSILVLSILGKLNPVSIGLDFTSNAPKDYNYKRKIGAEPSLERELFNFLAWKFDTIGNSLFGKTPDGENKSPTLYYQEKVDKITESTFWLIKAKMDCGEGQVACLKSVLKTGQTPEEVKEEEEKKGWSLGGVIASATGTDIILDFLGKAIRYLLNFLNPYFYLQMFLSVLEFIRTGMSFLVLIAYGLITAISLFFIKLFSPFALMKAYMGKFKEAIKYPMSAAMYGFLMKLFLFLSAIITDAMTDATSYTIMDKIESGKNVAQLLGVLGTITLSNGIAIIVITLMQIVALAKIPKFALSLINLSFAEILNMGEALFKAGIGAAKMVGMAAVTGGAALAGGAAGGAIGAIKGLAKKAGVKQTASKFTGRGMGSGPASGGGGGGPAPGAGFATGQSAKGGESKSTGPTNANMGKKASLLKKDKKKDSEDKVAVDETGSNPNVEKLDKDIVDEQGYHLSDKETPGDNDDKSLTFKDDEEEAKKLSKQKKRKEALKSFGKMAGGLAWGAFESGGSGKDGTDHITGKFTDIAKKGAELGAKKAPGAMTRTKNKTEAKVANFMEKRRAKKGKETSVEALHTAGDTSFLIDQDNKYVNNVLDDEGEERARELMLRAETNTATEDEMVELYKMNNQHTFNSELQKDYDALQANKNIDFGSSDKFASENKINEGLEARLAEQAKTGEFQQQDIALAGQRISSGMMSARFLSNSQGKEASIGEKLIGHREKKITQGFASMTKRKADLGAKKAKAIAKAKKKYANNDAKRAEAIAKAEEKFKMEYTKEDRGVAALAAEFMPQAFVGNEAANTVGREALGERSQLAKKVGQYRKSYAAPAAFTSMGFSSEEAQAVNPEEMADAVNSENLKEEGLESFLGTMAMDTDDNGTIDEIAFYDQYNKKKTISDFDDINRGLNPEDRARARASFDIAETIVRMAGEGRLDELRVKTSSGKITAPRITAEYVEKAKKLLEFRDRTEDKS